MGVFDCFRGGHCLAHATPSRQPPDRVLFPHYMQNAHGLWLHYAEWWPRSTHLQPAHARHRRQQPQHSTSSAAAGVATRQPHAPAASTVHASVAVTPPPPPPQQYDDSNTHRNATTAMVDDVAVLSTRRASHDASHTTTTTTAAAAAAVAASVSTLRGVVFIVAGLGEHTTRYDAVAQHLNAHGYVVFCLDNQGAGLSEGRRLYVERFAHFVDDVVQFMRHILLHTYAHLSLASLPCVLLGHSMGGLIATHVAARLCRHHDDKHSSSHSDSYSSNGSYGSSDDKKCAGNGSSTRCGGGCCGEHVDKDEPTAVSTRTTTTTTTQPSSSLSHDDGLPRLRALVLSGPALMPTPAPSALLRRLARVLSRLLPKLPVRKLRVCDISHHAPVVTLAAHDPCFGRAWLRARFVAELLAAQDDALHTTAAQLTLPLLIVHGEDDALCALTGSRVLLARVAAAAAATAAAATTTRRQQPRTMLRSYRGCGHEVLTEHCYAQVLDEVACFVNAHCDDNDNVDDDTNKGSDA